MPIIGQNSARNRLNIDSISELAELFVAQPIKAIAGGSAINAEKKPADFAIEINIGAIIISKRMLFDNNAVFREIIAIAILISAYIPVHSIDFEKRLALQMA